VEETVPVVCPACGEESDVGIDLTGGDEQEYEQGCPIC
jgi:hypothetical protein